MMFMNHLRMFLVVFVAFSFEKGLSLDLRGPAITTTQSSTADPCCEASKAVDRNINTISHTAFDTPEQQTNPWWKVDLGAVYCLRKITLVNRIGSHDPIPRRLYQGVIRAGLSPQHLLNPAVGQPVAYDDAISGAVLDFLPDPYVTAQYVSVDIPRSGSVNGINTILHMAEVMIEEVTMDPIKIDTPSSDKALTLTGLPSSHISTWGSWVASRAVDGSLIYDYNSGHDSSTNKHTNPWWKIDLTSVHCIGTIAVRNPDDNRSFMRLYLEGAVVRAGLSAAHLNNPTCGSPVALYQALINDWIGFTCPPSTLARYVSVNIPRYTFLHLAEVMVWPCDLHSSATNLAGKPSSQSSTEGSSTADRAIDTLPTEPYCSLTMREMNPWWMLDLESSQCLGQIRVWSSSQGTSFQDAVVRAGLSSIHTDNIACGRQVQASSDFVEFTCDPPVLARYFSVDIPGMAQLGLCEVTIATCDFTEKVDVGDLAVVVNPSLLGATGDNDSIIAVHRGSEEITSNVSFGRQVSTGGSSGLPSGSGKIVDPSLGCSVRLLRLPEQGGLDRTGTLYAQTTRNGLTTRIQTIILPKDRAHIRPVMRTQTASIGDSVVMEMLKVNPPTEAYRWRRDGGDIIEAWNDLLRVSISDVAKENEGVYSCFVLGREPEQLHGVMRLVVRDCPFGRWDLPSCLKTCRRCYNGGVCDDQSGACVCAPGFSGDSCEQVHGRAVFGKTAEQRCSNNTDPHNDACRRRLFCLPDPYGCSCAAGYMGLDCMQECDEGRFGADCNQTCHCALGSTCRKDTGECSNGCEAPYFGRNCQCSTQNGVLGLEVTSGDPHQLFVAWQPDPCPSGYEVTTKDDLGDIVSQELIPETSYHFITGLESTLNYMVSVRLLYPGGAKGPEATFPQTSTTEPPPGSSAVVAGSVAAAVILMVAGIIVIIVLYKKRSHRGNQPSGDTSLPANTPFQADVAYQVPEPVEPELYMSLSDGIVTISSSQHTAPNHVSSHDYEHTLSSGEPHAYTYINPDTIQKKPLPQTRKKPNLPAKRNAAVSGTYKVLDSAVPASLGEGAEKSPALPDARKAVHKPHPMPSISQIVADEDVHEQWINKLFSKLSVRLDELDEYIRKKDQADQYGFPADFETLPDGQLRLATVAMKPQNAAKNCDADITVYDHSRVVLEPLQSDPHSDYINACYVDGYLKKDKYIASQGPMESTVGDFWRMVWQTKVDKIIMLTNLVENNKVMCHQYWPDTGFTHFSDIAVSIVEEDEFQDYTVRVFQMNKFCSTESNRLVTQFQFKIWPDMKLPEHPTTLLNFMHRVNAMRNEGQTIVHCSNGIGRTGTYIALDSMLDQMQQERQVDVLGFIYRMRQKRNKMVQTPAQYRFIFEALLATSKDGGTV